MSFESIFIVEKMDHENKTCFCKSSGCYGTKDKGYVHQLNSFALSLYRLSFEFTSS
jgi:hypothetical protein